METIELYMPINIRYGMRLLQEISEDRFVKFTEVMEQWQESVYAPFFTSNITSNMLRHRIMIATPTGTSTATSTSTATIWYE